MYYKGCPLRGHGKTAQWSSEEKRRQSSAEAESTEGGVVLYTIYLPVETRTGARNARSNYTLMKWNHA